jgi:predicted ester cyclase
MKDLYRRWLQGVWGAGRLELSRDLIAEDIVDHNPYQGQPEGRRGQDWAVAMVRKSFPDLHFTEDVVICDGEFVCGRWTMTGTNTGVMDLFRLPPTGRPVKMTGQEIFRVGDGKFTEVWHQEDVPGMLTQLGLEPPALMLRLAAQRSARRYRKERRHVASDDV